MPTVFEMFIDCIHWLMLGFDSLGNIVRLTHMTRPLSPALVVHLVHSYKAVRIVRRHVRAASNSPTQMNVVRWKSIANLSQECTHRRVNARLARIEDLHCALDAVDRLVRFTIRPAHGDQLRHCFAPRKGVPRRVDLRMRRHGARHGTVDSPRESLECRADERVRSHRPRPTRSRRDRQRMHPTGDSYSRVFETSAYLFG